MMGRRNKPRLRGFDITAETVFHPRDEDDMPEIRETAGEYRWK